MIGTIMGTVLIFIIVLSLLVFVHELGHFLMAKKMGMKVEEFGFGFPPRLYGIQKGETIYSINWIPLGGFVRIKGESGENAHDHDSFASKSATRRLVVLVAGVAMNFLLAAVLFSIAFMIGVPNIIDDNLPHGARVSETSLTFLQVVDGSPAHEAGLTVGDTLISIDGQMFDSENLAREYLLTHGTDGVSISYASASGKTQTAEMSAEPLIGFDLTGIGLGIAQTGIVSFSPIQATVQGVVATVSMTAEVGKAFVGVIRDLVAGHQPGVDLSGPVGIAVLTGQVAALGIVHLIQFTALLSINLGVINVLPFPALDGGRVLFLLIEKLRGGKPVDARVESAVHNTGFALLMLLVVLVTYRDIVNFF
jgi:regulator of sigma E protease